MSYRRVVLTAGFAMFSMFFGSGNLVFPLLLGKEVMDMSVYATFGFVLTAVFVPFLGLLGMILYDGDTNRYFSHLGKIPAFLLILIILSLMGPLGVVPRCISVAYGGLNVMYPSLSYPGFSLIYCTLIAILIWRSNKVVDIIGLLLTPFKLGGLMFLMLAGLYFAQSAPVSAFTGPRAFHQGLTLGYHTMDLMAAFFFSATTVKYLRDHLREGDGRSKLLRLSISSALIGALILSLSYIGFVALGAKYALQLDGVRPESLLVVISQMTLGDIALPIVSFTMFVACLATSVILTILFVEFFQKEVTSESITEKQSIVLTVIMTFAMSLLGFQKIYELLGIILENIYPALIVLAITNIVNVIFQKDYGKVPFWVTLGMSILYGIVMA